MAVVGGRGWGEARGVRVSFLAEDGKRIGETDKAGTTSQQKFCPHQYYQKDHHPHTQHKAHDAALRRKSFWQISGLALQLATTSSR